MKDKEKLSNSNESSKKHYLVIAFLIIVVGAGMFYAGMTYEKKKLGSNSSNNGERTLGNRQFGDRQTGDRTTGVRTNHAPINANFVAGEIIAKDDNSITVKLGETGSKIIYFSDNTSIGKSTEGTKEDLAVGERVMINGTGNDDGSLAATNIQIRPELPVNFGQGASQADNQ